MDHRSNAKLEGIGARVLRKEDRRFLTGSGRYIDDFALPNMLYAVVVRSPIAHGQLLEVDAGPAIEKNPSVICLTAADVDPLPTIPIRVGATPELMPYLQRPLASDIVRFVGEPVAVVLAETPHQAEDAAERVRLRISELPVIIDPGKALKVGAPQIHPGHSNCASSWIMQKGRVEEVLRDAPIVIEESFELARHTGLPMEPRGLLAYYDLPRDILQVWGPTKLPYINRVMLSRMLSRAQDSIQFIEPDVGGSFGVRGEFYPEDFLIPYSALKTGRPVKWIETRQEHLLSINHSREQRWRVKLAADNDGRLIALDAEFINDMGAYLRTHGTVVPHHACTSFPGPYYLDHYRCSVACTITNRTPTGTLRAPGMFESGFVRERAMDMLANKLGIAPDEVRRRNFIRPDQMPYQICRDDHGPFNPAYDNGDFPRIFEESLKACDYVNRRSRAHKGSNGLAVAKGVGVATAVEPTGLGPFERAKLRVDMQGQINVFVGATSQGQGLETSLAQICADVFDLPIDAITVRHGDSALLNIGWGSSASRTAVVAGNAVYRGALELKRKVIEASANFLKAAPEDIIYDSGALYVSADPSRRVTLAELANASTPFASFMNTTPLAVKFAGEGLEVNSHVSNVSEGTCVFSVHVAEVSVDLETGAIGIDRYFIGCDIGRAINPMIVEGQIAGGVAHGIGGSLFERLVFDDSGQLLSGSLMDYAVPFADSVPMIEMMIMERIRSETNSLGVKGVGEVGTSGAGAAIANAVADALRGTGAEITALPITTESIVRRLGKIGAKK
jgi:CO/xanthine dehydrogenase Mo-binding subunit